MRPGKGSPGAILLPNGDSQKTSPMVKVGKGHRALRTDMKVRETFPLCKHTTGGAAFSREEGNYLLRNLSFLEFDHARSFIYFCMC